MRTLNVSNSSSIAESDISIATLPAIPDSTSRDINDLFGIKLRINDKNKHVSGSSSDIFPISKIKRPKSMPDFRIIKDLSDDESDSMNKHDPVIARTHNLPKFHANITKKEEKSYKTSISISLHNIGANKEPIQYEGKNYNSSTNFGTFTRDRKSGNRMYDFIRKYENKKSLNEVHSYVHHDEPKSEDKNVTTPVEYDEEKQIKQATDVSFSVPLKPKFKKRGSMQDFLKMYSNKTTLPPISNREEIEVIPQVIINNSVENLNNSFDFSTKQKQEDSVDLNVSGSNEKKITYTSEVSMQVIDNKDSKESNTSGPSKNYENAPTSEDSNSKTTEIIPTNKSEPNSPQVEMFVYGSTNKPKIKPKPDFLSNSKNAIEEDTVDNSMKEISNSDRLLEISVDSKPDYNKEKYKFKVSKFHILPSTQISEDKITRELNTPSLNKEYEEFSVTKVSMDQEIESISNNKTENKLQHVSTHIDNTCDDKLHQVNMRIDDKSGNRPQSASLPTYYKAQENIYFKNPREEAIQHTNIRTGDNFEDRSQQVSTLIYGSMNKPMTMSKPKKIDKVEIKIAENSENPTKMPQNSNDILQITSDITIPNDKIRVSKYHITTKNTYHQYLQNYSNIKSLKEIRNQRDNSENLKSAHTTMIEGNTDETLFNSSNKDYKESESRDNRFNGKKSTTLQSTKSELDFLMNTSNENCKGTSSDIVSKNEIYSKGYNDHMNTIEVKRKKSSLHFKDNTKHEEKQSLNTDSNFKHVLDKDLHIEKTINIYETSEDKKKGNNETLNEVKKTDKFKNEERILIPKSTKNSNINSEVNNINKTLINYEKNSSSNKSVNNENLVTGNRISPNVSAKIPGADSTSQFVSELVEKIPKYSVNESKVANFSHNASNEETTPKNSTTNHTKIDPISTENTSAVKPNNILVINSQQNETFTETDVHIKELKQVLNTKPSDLDTETNTTFYIKPKAKPPTPPIIDDDDTDPLSLTKRIVKGARVGSSGLSAANKYNISMASLPAKSPFVYKPRKFEDVPEGI